MCIHIFINNVRRKNRSLSTHYLEPHYTNNVSRFGRCLMRRCQLYSLTTWLRSPHPVSVWNSTEQTARVFVWGGRSGYSGLRYGRQGPKSAPWPRPSSLRCLCGEITDGDDWTLDPNIARGEGRWALNRHRRPRCLPPAPRRWLSDVIYFLNCQLLLTLFTGVFVGSLLELIPTYTYSAINNSELCCKQNMFWLNLLVSLPMTQISPTKSQRFNKFQIYNVNEND